jgi:predicted DNA-binding WGR domain protein
MRQLARDPYDPPGKLYDLTLEGDAEVAVRWGRGAKNYSRYEEFRDETAAQG